MEERAVRQFVELEQQHFWFVGRRRIFTRLLEREMSGSDARILDVGCGAGGMLGPLSRFGCVAGIDSSPELVQVCHERGFARVSVHEAQTLPAATASLDLVTLFDVIEHIAADGAVLTEVMRVLKPGGLVCLSVPAYRFLYANNDRVAHHQRRYTAGEMRQKLAAAGFRITQITYFNTFLFPAILPTVLGKKLLEHFREPGDRTNLSHAMRPRLNAALGAIMSAERHLLARGSFPAGHSLIALARKPVRGTG